MNLNNVTLKNFRCFSDLSIDLHPSLTVIVAENGQGKSTILDAIRIGLWPYLNSIDLATSGSNDPANNISVDDVRMIPTGYRDMVRQLSAIVSLTGNYGEGNVTWVRTREKETPSSKTINDDSAKKLELFATRLQADSRILQKAKDVHFPLLAYYGTGRLWSQKKLTEKKRAGVNESENDPLIRTYGYRDCMDPSSSYRFFKDWFIWSTEINIDDLLKNRETPPEELTSFIPIQVVRDATDVFLKETTGWNSLEYDRLSKKIVLQHPVNGTISVDLLSDGIRSILAMIGDIAYRCYQLNPSFGTDAARKTKGIVLIDEIDMHLHPKWQQVIAAQLQKAFPNIQFVVTTHSPQVLTTVNKESIRILTSDGQAIIPMEQTEGVESGLAMSRNMYTDPLPQNIDVVKKLSRYISLIEQGIFNTEANEIRKQLISHFGNHDSRIISSETIAKLKNPEKFKKFIDEVINA